jgi:hypothetical protein
MLLTALSPAPPIPKTLIFARYSGAIIVGVSGLTATLGVPAPVEAATWLALVVELLLLELLLLSFIDSSPSSKKTYLPAMPQFRKPKQFQRNRNFREAYRSSTPKSNTTAEFSSSRKELLTLGLLK